MDSTTLVALAMGLALLLAMLFIVRLPHLLARRSGLNETDDWTPGPDVHPETPPMTPLTPYTLEIVTSYLEAGETLEGFARAYFEPARMKDFKIGSGIEKLPLVVAATQRRILLFEVTLLIVHRTCFIPYEQVASLRPPKPGLFGTSGQMRIDLKSGRAYQFGFHGPLLSEEGMQQEQALAEHFRSIAWRFEGSSASDSSRAAA